MWCSHRATTTMTTITRFAVLYACSVLASCLLSGLECRTVSPDLYVTTTDAGMYVDDPLRAFGGARYRNHAQYGYGEPRDRDVGSTNRYGHRSLPAAMSVMRRGRDYDDDDNGGGGVAAGNHALYETPKTYEYMNSPGGGKSQRIRGPPKTEMRPPSADDVELVPVDEDRGRRNVGVAGDEKKRKARPHALWPSSSGNDGAPLLRNDGGANAERYANGKRTVKKNKNKKKKKKKKSGAKATKAAASAAHEVHQKKQYSNKQQFIDENHVDHGKKKPVSTVKNGHQQRQQQQQQQLQQQQRQQQQQQLQQQQRQHGGQLQQQRQHGGQLQHGAVNAAGTKHKRLVKKHKVVQSPQTLVQSRQPAAYGHVVAVQ